MGAAGGVPAANVAWWSTTVLVEFLQQHHHGHKHDEWPDEEEELRAKALLSRFTPFSPHADDAACDERSANDQMDAEFRNGRKLFLWKHACGFRSAK